MRIYAEKAFMPGGWREHQVVEIENGVIRAGMKAHLTGWDADWHSDKTIVGDKIYEKR